MSRDFHLPGRSAVIAANGMAATSHPLAAKVAVQMLEAGGSAADAAIAAAVLLGFCEPQMTGLGGDMFALVGGPAQPVVALNGSGRAPAALDADRIRAAGHAAMPTEGALTVTLPGAVAGFCALHDRFGRLPLDQVLAPAIRYADAGVPIAPRVALDLAGDAPRLGGRARDHFLIDGRAPRLGEVFRAPGQAEVLRRIAARGAAGFYRGEVAEDMVASLRALGGVHTAEDFAGVTADWGTPLSAAHAGAEVLEHPPNGQGATALLMLNILARFDLAAMDPLGPDRAHLEAEAAKLAYDARNRIIADPDRTTRLAAMLAPETADRLAALIDPARALTLPLPAVEALHRDTVYLAVVDRDRLAVSLIYSIYWGFGAGIASDRFGLLFQNRGAGFSLVPGHPNEAAGGRRPLHTIIPGMIRDQGGLSPFGVMGGAYQPAGHARLVGNLRAYGMTVQEAIDAPRSFPDQGVLKLERDYSPDVAAALAGKGHAVSIPDEPLGGAQAILTLTDGLLVGGSDPRKDGCALGY
jgi:gamma-glutamyltranspeptidase/glutathione hydrolase